MAKLPEIIKLSADPAAGAEISYTADEAMIIHSLVFTLVTSAVVANRTVVLAADDGNAANEFWRDQLYAAQTASQTQKYSCYEGAARTPAGQSAAVYTIPLPVQGLRLRAGDRLRTASVGLDAGDNYSAVTIQAERV